ncbi:MAG: MBL fold metallo-hydrolase [Granulosicoccus sp.]
MIKPDFDGKRFSYPGNLEQGSRWDVLRWAITRKPARWPRDLTNPVASPVVDKVGNGALRVSFINHATVLIQCDQLNIITDPVFSKRVSPVRFAGPRRYRPAGLSLDELPPIDAILISHTHYDHLDIRSIERLCNRDNPAILAPLKSSSIIDSVSRQPTTELSWWDSHVLNDATRVSLVPARHWTSRKPGDENQCLWGGFVISFDSGAVYFAGDTGYGDGEHFRQAQAHLGPFRCALIPIGAYEPRWFMKPQHMNPDEAVKAFKDLQVHYALGIHHGTFQLTDEAHDAPVKDLKEALSHSDIDDERFITLANGGAWDVPSIHT